jgi:hypothetical protein
MAALLEGEDERPGSEVEIGFGGTVTKNPEDQRS